MEARSQLPTSFSKILVRECLVACDNVARLMCRVAKIVPNNRCLGKRPWDPKKKVFGDYVFEDYKTVQQRRKDFGVGLVHLHAKYGVFGTQYGVGLWCQNRPEWQLTGMYAEPMNKTKANETLRSGLYVPKLVHRFSIRHPRTRYH